MFVANTMKYTIDQEVGLSFRLVKIADIVYTTIVSCALVLLLLRLLQGTAFAWIESMINQWSKPGGVDAPHQIIVFTLFCILFSLFAVLAYVLRNFIELIPSPFHGVRGLNHRKLREIADISSLVLIILITQTSMYVKLMNVLMSSSSSA